MFPHARYSFFSKFWNNFHIFDYTFYNNKNEWKDSMKTFFSQSSYTDMEKNTLLDDISKTKYALEIAYSGFDYVTEPDLIDSYIYQVNAILKRYKYLIEQAAKLNLLPADDLYQETSVGRLVH